MRVSNMKAGALEREQNAGAEVCPYGPFSILANTLEKFDTIMIHSSSSEQVLSQKIAYLKHMVLLETFFRDFDIYFSQKKKKFKENIITLVGKERNDTLYVISFYVTRLLLFLMLRFSEQKIKENQENSPGELPQKFLQNFENAVEKYVGDPQNKYRESETWEFIYTHLLEIYQKNHPSDFQNPAVVSEIFWGYISRAFKRDTEKGFLDVAAFQDFGVFCNQLESLNEKKDTRSLLISRLAEYGISFQVLYAMVGSTAKQFKQQSQYQDLCETDTKKMFFSIKRDLMVDARFWSKQFTNDNEHTHHYTHAGSMVWFLPDTGTIPIGKLIFDFERKEISLDASTYPETPIKPEIKTIRRGCPVAFVAGEGLGGNFLARQIDTALDIIYEIYLKEKS